MLAPAHFVLVHGAGHGAWCWFMVQCLLETAGHNVTSLDLAGAGIHPSDPDSVRTFPSYDKPLFDFIRTLPMDEKVILVGHSAGGLSLVHIMHEFGEKIDVAIFIAAVMLPSGYVSEEDKKIGLPDLSKYGDVFDIRFSGGNNSAPTSASMKKEFEHELLYQLSPRKYSTLASKLLRPWPIQALSSARFEGRGGEEKARRVRRVFIKTRHDRMLSPTQQDAMIRRWPPSKGDRDLANYMNDRRFPLTTFLSNDYSTQTIALPNYM